jgi:adenylosuccinate lyase
MRWRMPASSRPKTRALSALARPSISRASTKSSRRRSTMSSRLRRRSPRKAGPSARWLHFGLTSSDVIDTAQAIQLRQACDLILADLDALSEAIRTRAFEHRRTLMIGRTHGVHAEPMTLGVKLALWYAEVARDRVRVARARDVIAVGKISGAVGMFAHLDPSIEAAVCARLGLTPAPVSSQVIQRDRHAEVMTALAITAATLEKCALEIRGLQKTEIGEVEEPFGRGQKGSSAMPHKRNPIGCEQIVGLARLIRANAMAALENVALWHERDISHSSVERVILPDSFIALDHMLRRLTKIIAGMVVYPDRMMENLKRSRGVVYSGRFCWSWRAAACRASRRTSGFSATRCDRSTSSAISRSCC